MPQQNTFQPIMILSNYFQKPVMQKPAKPLNCWYYGEPVLTQNHFRTNKPTNLPTILNFMREIRTNPVPQKDQANVPSHFSPHVIASIRSNQPQ